MFNVRSVDVIDVVVNQHAAELAILWHTRRGTIAAGHVALRHQARFDERMAAHLDGCVVAGREGLKRLMQQLAEIDAARLFAYSSVALDLQDRAALDYSLGIAESARIVAPGLRSALGWVEATALTGIVRNMLGASSPLHRSYGLAACRLHGADPGRALRDGLRDTDSEVRAEALRLIGERGEVALRDECVSALCADDANVRFDAARSAVLSGDRSRAVDALRQLGLSSTPCRRKALRLALQAMDPAAVHATLQSLVNDRHEPRWLLESIGVAGDPVYVPWLIGEMARNETARVAGEAFSLITGLDLPFLNLERKPPQEFESGPNDDPNDANVDMDPDDGLPWPDQQKIERWWAANGSRFRKGQRYFMGAPVTRQHCVDVLKNGYQRQRILAAHYLCLLEPGTPLFNTSAPAWRQQRLLAAMS